MDGSAATAGHRSVRVIPLRGIVLERVTSPPGESPAREGASGSGGIVPPQGEPPSAGGTVPEGWEERAAPTVSKVPGDRPSRDFPSARVSRVNTGLLEQAEAVRTERPEDRIWMQELSPRRAAAEIGEVPIARDRAGEGGGERGRRSSAGPKNGARSTAIPCHAEILAIRQAAERVGGWRLTGCTMYVSLEPCAMCAGALVNSRIERLVWGAPDPKAGWCGTLGNLVQDPRLNHRLEMTAGVLEEDSAALLRGFFASLRKRF